MTDQTPKLTEQEAFIPPYYMLILALAGLLVALAVLVTQPTFTVVGWGALGIGGLALVAWVLMAPDQAKAVITGRTARFGGTSLVVTAVFIVALIAIYALIRAQGWRADLTERDTFSLTEESRQAIAGIGADPNLPSVKLLAFYGAAQAGRRDQDTLLFDDYAETSAGKISYEFVDPERNPQLTELYKVTSNGQIAVVALNEAGEPDVENAELVSFFSQDGLTNAILRVAAQGDFRAYFLNVDGGLGLTDSSVSGMSLLNDSLINSYDWKTQQVSLFELMGEQSEIKLNDPAADGEVLVIPGGNKPLSDDEMAFIASYVGQGGSLVIFASPSLQVSATDGGEASLSANQPLALTENMSNFLYENFGLRFRNDLVLDPTLSLQSPLRPVAVDFSSTHYITRNFVAKQSGIVFDLPHSIEIAPTLPENVTVDELARSSDASFSKADIQAIINSTNIEQLETDPKGPFVLAAAAENTATGARVVLFGSASVPSNNFALGSGLVNLEASFSSLVWATRFNDFFGTVNIQSAANAQDVPVFATDQELRNINLMTLIVLPFGVLAIGFIVWWNNRERARTL
ncbi:MAG: Gldg family protein [Chloroflexi bacterium]|nr:Gldg family protein [Chloroflexota bacterium]